MKPRGNFKKQRNGRNSQRPRATPSPRATSSNSGNAGRGVNEQRRPFDRSQSFARTSHGRGLAGREDVIMGRNCISEVFERTPERILEAWIAGGESRAGNQRQNGIEESLNELSIEVHVLSRDQLTELVGSESHQGFVARVAPRKLWELDALVTFGSQKQRSIILALDTIVDPQNLGAILRAAECLGVDGVVWSKNRGAPITPVVAKVSVGATELVRLCPISNLQRGLEQCKKEGYWIVGAAVGKGSESLDTFTFPERAVVVMGAEGEGLSHIIEENLDFRVSIRMYGQIDSLNVSQATAVILAAAARSHRTD